MAVRFLVIAAVGAAFAFAVYGIVSAAMGG